MIARFVIDGYAKSFLAQKESAEQAFRQLDHASIHWRPAENTNSVAILVKHLSGHLRSRFTDFFTSDGEQPNRNREGELTDEPVSLQWLEAAWQESWGIVFSTLDSLTDDDLNKIKKLRGEEIIVADYIPRVLVHTAYHTGQIVLLSKQYLGDKWRKLE